MAAAELEIKVTSRDVPVATQQLKDLEGQGGKTGGSIDKLKSAAAAAGESIRSKLTSSIESLRPKVEAAASAVSSKLTAAMEGLKTVAKGVAIAVGAALVAALVSAVKANIQFEKSLSSLAAITGATGDQLDYFKAQAMDIGAKTSLSASEAAEAFKLIAAAKPDLLESSSALNAVTRSAVTLAEATGMTLPDAAKALGGALNQFGAGAEEADRFINVLAASSTLGAAEVVDVAESLKAAGVSAAGAGVPFEELNASIQTLAKVGIKGAEAGTSMRNIILMLETSADKKLKPSINGLNGALKNLADMGEDSTQMLKRFGLQNVNSAQALINNTGELDKLTEAMTGTNLAHEQASKRMDNLDGDMKNLSSAVESLSLVIGEILNPALRTVTQYLTDAARGVTVFFDSMRDAPSTIEGATDKFQGLQVEIFKLSAAAAELRANGTGLFGPNKLDIKKAEALEAQVARLRIEAEKVSDQVEKLKGGSDSNTIKKEKKEKPIAEVVVEDKALTDAEAKRLADKIRREREAEERILVSKRAAADKWLYDVQAYQMSETELVDRWEQEQLAKLREYQDARPEALQETAQALIAIEEEKARKLGEIEDNLTQKRLEAIRLREDAEKQSTSKLREMQMGLASDSLAAISSAAEEGSSMQKAAFLLSKGMSAAQAIQQGEIAAMGAVAAYTTAAAAAGPAAPAMVAAGEAKAMQMRAMGYTSAGVIMAQGFAGAFDGGGNIGAGKFGLVAERGSEFANGVLIQGPAKITGRKDTERKIEAAGGVGGGATTNIYNITQNISGNGDDALAQVVEQATQNAITEVKRDAATNGPIRRMLGV
jgi:TP901 family phage tail tape measure protein